MVLPYINMNLPQVYTCSPSWIPLPSPSPYHPSGSSQCTSPKHPVSCIEPGLAIHFIYNIIHVSVYDLGWFGMIWENGIETCIISYMKQVASPGSMHDTGCLGLVHWNCFSNKSMKWSRSVVSDSLRPRGLQPARLLCPWDFPGKNTGGGCFLLQRIFPTQGSNLGLLHCTQFLYQLSHQRTLSLWLYYIDNINIKVLFTSYFIPLMQIRHNSVPQPWEYFCTVL